MERRPDNQFPEIRFLHVRHAKEDFNDVWEEARKADVILLEAVGPTNEARVELESTVRLIPRVKNPILKFLAKNMLIASLGDSDQFGVSFYKKAIEENKELRLIDVENTDIAYFENLVSEEDLKQSYLLFREGNIEESFNRFVHGTIFLGESIAKRDKTTSAQIQKMINDNTQWYGKKIAVVQGSEHTSVYHDFVKNNPHIEASRIFMPDKNHEFSLSYEFRKRSQITGNDMDKLGNIIKLDYIRTFIIIPGLNKKVKDSFKRNKISQKIAKQMSQEDVVALFGELKRVNFTGSRMNKAKREIYVDMQVQKLSKFIVEKHSSFLKKLGY